MSSVSNIIETGLGGAPGRSRAVSQSQQEPAPGHPLSILAKPTQAKRPMRFCRRGKSGMLGVVTTEICPNQSGCRRLCKAGRITASGLNTTGFLTLRCLLLLVLFLCNAMLPHLWLLPSLVPPGPTPLELPMVPTQCQAVSCGTCLFRYALASLPFGVFIWFLFFE